MSEREKKLQELGYALENITTPRAKYVLLKQAGNLLYSSGMLPMEGETLTSPGKVPSTVPLETAKKCAALCVANILRAVHRDYGSLDMIKQAVKLTGFVNSEPTFTEQHLILNSASELLLEVFDKDGEHARSALGVAALPLNSCVEVEIIFELNDA
jgi:enamine deaminase RidA (YjgF/YER057c/UK114 family)